MMTLALATSKPLILLAMSSKECKQQLFVLPDLYACVRTVVTNSAGADYVYAGYQPPAANPNSHSRTIAHSVSVTSILGVTALPCLGLSSPVAAGEAMVLATDCTPLFVRTVVPKWI